MKSHKLSGKEWWHLLLFTAMVIAFAVPTLAQNLQNAESEVAICKVTVNNKIVQPKLEHIGFFDKVYGIKTNTVVPNQIFYPAGAPGEKVIVSVMDGGALEDNQIVRVLSLDNE